MGPPASKAALRPRLIVSSGLSLIAGYSDVISFLMFEEFAGMMTGNMVFLGGVLVNGPQERALYNIAVMASNMAGVMLFCALREVAPERAFELAAPMCATLTALAEIMNAIVGKSKWNVCFLAASLGASNFLSFSGPIGGMTTLATGNLQKAAKGLFKVVVGQPFDEVEREATCVAGIVVLSTILGAVVGAAVLTYNPLGISWLLAPVAILQLAILALHDKILRDEPGVDASPFLAPQNEDNDDAKHDDGQRFTTLDIAETESVPSAS
ncbi:hypothetical protein CTAYLR_010077 [Chrysophaeum taylorii]|uniref:DUF1275 domain-containing protein n=1 Tax=Chrysophaeum taylorii TaxID=2483200 RepID=A0AAD7UBN2_9STRA|nr:hypothetical protein CTAYLR_010077 [Chrysophaeum taylorii]